MSEYAHLDFTTWSSKAELVGDVAEVLSPQLLQQYPGTSLKRPGDDGKPDPKNDIRNIKLLRRLEKS